MSPPCVVPEIPDAPRDDDLARKRFGAVGAARCGHGPSVRGGTNRERHVAVCPPFSHRVIGAEQFAVFQPASISATWCATKEGPPQGPRTGNRKATDRVAWRQRVIRHPTELKQP